MRARLFALAARKAALLERSRADRERVAELLGASRGPLALAGAAALLAALKPRRALGWVARGWSVLQIYRAARSLW